MIGRQLRRQHVLRLVDQRTVDGEEAPGYAFLIGGSVHYPVIVGDPSDCHIDPGLIPELHVRMEPHAFARGQWAEPDAVREPVVEGSLRGVDVLLHHPYGESAYHHRGIRSSEVYVQKPLHHRIRRFGGFGQERILVEYHQGLLLSTDLQDGVQGVQEALEMRKVPPSEPGQDASHPAEIVLYAVVLKEGEEEAAFPFGESEQEGCLSYASASGDCDGCQAWFRIVRFQLR